MMPEIKNGDAAIVIDLRHKNSDARRLIFRYYECGVDLYTVVELSQVVTQHVTKGASST